MPHLFQFDELSHVYTLILYPNNTIKIFADYEERIAGDLEEHYDFLKPRRIMVSVSFFFIYCKNLSKILSSSKKYLQFTILKCVIKIYHITYIYTTHFLFLLLQFNVLF